ncbi:MAG: C10 family peptidase, partial [Phycisphaerales bacterium]
EGIGVHAYDITVDGTAQTAYTMGGDEEGGPYEWGLMVPVPADGASTEECQAIGALCYDAGVAAGMSYTSTGSSAPIWSASRAFWPFTFDYGFAINGQAVSGFVTNPDLYEMVNPNLDYRHPVILKISDGPADPHAVVADGYGYNAGTLYHHINMGWAGLDDAWYSLPLVAGYTLIDESIYNIFVTGSGEIISGRALDGSGDPVGGVIVTAKAIDGTFTASAETDEKGIYAVAPVPSNTTFRMSAAKAGFHTADKLVTTGQSLWYASVSGNRWGIDFTSSVMFVDVDAPDGGDGSSWANAYNRLQDALAAVQQGQQIWVAEGVYRPDQGSGVTPDDQDATFTLGNCVTVCGGFAGDEDATIFDLSWRDLAARETILSGDVGIPGSVDDNSFHVLTASGVDPTAILDGFVIQDGNADDYPFPPYEGGGAYVISGSPTLRNCIFRANRAVSYGGGLYCDGGNPEVVDCTFTSNFAGTDGGAVAIWSGTPTLIHCTITENEALNAGGGIVNAGNAALANCAFIENLAGIGGGMANVNCSPNLTNCTFSENLATGEGGGMYNIGSNLTVVNCILWGNSDVTGTGEQAQIYTYSGTPTVTYSCIQDDDPDDSYIPYGGAANQNIDDDPWFLAGPTGCYYLSQTSAGQTWQSPCVDAGDGPASDHGLDSRTTRRDEGPDENVVDMGFHYAISGVSFVYGDFDRSGGIDPIDFLEFAECLVGPCLNPPCDPSYYVGPCCSIADFDDNCSLDLADFVSFQLAFGE